MRCLKICQHVICKILHDFADLFRRLYLTISDGFVETFHLLLIVLAFFGELLVNLIMYDKDKEHEYLIELANNETIRKIVHAGFIGAWISLGTLRFNRDERGYGKFSTWGFCIYPITWFIIWRFPCVYTTVNFLFIACVVGLALFIFVFTFTAMIYRMLELLYLSIKRIMNYFKEKYYEAVEEMDTPENTTKVQPLVIDTPDEELKL